MRTRWIVTSILCILATFLLVFRHQGVVLSDLARTYTQFHPYIDHHPEVLFRIPDLQPSKENISLPSPVPKIIHQIALGNTAFRLEKYAPAIESCKTHHATWEFHLWTDHSGEAFMQKHYPDLFSHYKSYKQDIQRANILRYALLHHFGGIYLDLDITCRVALDAPLNPLNRAPALTYLPFLTPGAAPAAVNNAFILSRPGHPLLTYLLSQVSRHDLSWGMPYAENMLSTGCGFFGNMWMQYVFSGPLGKEDRVYVLADERGGMEAQMLRGKIVTSLFEHGGASSWHGWDAALFVVIGRHYVWFVVGLVCAVGCFVVGSMRLRLLRRQRTRSEDQEELLSDHTYKRG